MPGACTWPCSCQAAVPMPSGCCFSWLALRYASLPASQLAFAVTLMGRSLHDPLTGCHTRGSVAELLEMNFAAASRTGAPLSVAFLDLDHFKAVNDAFGHESGDQILVGAARRLLAGLRGSETVGRWGGEEFVVVFPGKAAREAIHSIERIRSAGLGQRPNGQPVTVSVGIAERIEDDCATWAPLIHLADQRMYAAKTAGRDRVVGPKLLPAKGTTTTINASQVPARRVGHCSGVALRLPERRSARLTDLPMAHRSLGCAAAASGSCGAGSRRRWCRRPGSADRPVRCAGGRAPAPRPAIYTEILRIRP